MASPNLGLQHPPISEFRAISDRPLFTPSRRPAPPAATGQVQLYRLHGVLTTNRQKVALVESIEDGALLRLSEGDTVSVWRVAAIGRDSITWSRLDRPHEVIVAETNGGGEALSPRDISQSHLFEDHDASEQTNAMSDMNTPRRQTAGVRVLTHRRFADGAEYAPIFLPTESLPPTPPAPGRPPTRRIWGEKGPA